MNSNRLFMFLFALTGGATLWLGAQFFYALNIYFSLSRQAPAQVTEWKVIEREQGKFIIEAGYQFQFDEKTVKGTYVFSDTRYLNPVVAESDIDEFKEKSWTVWYHPKQPHKAALQKKFPAKKAVHFAVALGVIVYFNILRMYLRRLNAA